MSSILRDSATRSVVELSFNAILVVGRVIGFAVAMAILWFIVGPAFGEENAFATIAAFFVLGFVGILAGQWVALKVMRG